MGRVLFLGFDGVEPDLLSRWMKSGELPNLASLVARGGEQPVVVHRTLGDGAIWPSIYTGTGVANHGRLFRLFMEPGSYEITKFKYKGKLRRQPFWQTLSDDGRKVAVVDMVRAPFTPNIKGIQVNEWLEHDGGDCECWPPETAAELQRIYPGNPLQGNSSKWLQRNQGDYVGLRDHLLDQLRAKTAFLKKLTEDDSYDLITTVFGEGHDFGHLGWHLHDPSHYDYDAEWVQKHGDPVKTIYQACDDAIGELLNAVDDQTRVFVFAGIGMEPNWTGNLILDDVLCKLEHRPVSRLRSLYRALIPRSLRHQVRRLSFESPAVGELKNSSKRNERAARNCFVIPHNDHAGTIRLNIAGRDPQGKLQPGKEVEEYLEWLTGELSALVDVDTGKPVVKKIYRSADLWAGEHLDDLPDLFVVWDRAVPFHRVYSEKVGEMTVEPPRLRPGDHTNHAAFYTDRELPEGVTVELEDIAPTLAAMLETKLDQADGKVLESLI